MARYAEPAPGPPRGAGGVDNAHVSDPIGGGEAPSYEQAREELAAIVVALEGGGQTLEQALTLWERGEVLATICQSWLDNARERLETAPTAQTKAIPGDT